MINIFVNMKVIMRKQTNIWAQYSLAYGLRCIELEETPVTMI